MREQQGRFFRYMERNGGAFIAKRDGDNDRLTPVDFDSDEKAEIPESDDAAESAADEGAVEGEGGEAEAAKPLPRLLETNDFWLHISQTRASDDFPAWVILAMILLTMVPTYTSVGNERRFSTTNYVFNEFRSRLAVDTLEEWLRLHASRDLYGTLAEFPVDEVYKRWKVLECEGRSARLAAAAAAAGGPPRAPGPPAAARAAQGDLLSSSAKI